VKWIYKMTKVVMINKGGSVKTETVKSLKVSDLYKKCKFRKPDDFAKRHTWKYKNKWVSVYAKNKGRANSENKYDLPPPIDNDLYFGNLLVIMHTNETPADSEVCDFDKETWFESVSPSQKTKEGYLKDGFVVSDDIEEEDEEDSDYECPSEEESADENTDNEDEDDEEANYGGVTEDEEEDEDEEDEDSEVSDDDPASELSEEEYSY